MYDTLPEDVCILITDFLHGKCNKCNITYHFKTLKYDWISFKYKSVFDDSYFFKEKNETIRIICHHCIRKYHIRNLFE